MTIDSGIMSLV